MTNANDPRELIDQAEKLSGSSTNTEVSFKRLLEQMTNLEERLFEDEVVAQVKTLPRDEITRFVAARSDLIAGINQLRARQLTNLSEQLAQQTALLEKNMLSLDQQLVKLENVSAWTSAINSILGVVGELVTL